MAKIDSNNEVVKILMRRDGLSAQEAIDLVEECADALECGQGDAIEYYLGLEDDYIFDIL